MRATTKRIKRRGAFIIFVVALVLSSPVTSLWAEQPQYCFGACEAIDTSSTQNHQVKHADVQALAFRTASFIQENRINLRTATRVESGIAVDTTLPASPAAPDRAVINPPVVRNTAAEGSSNPMPPLLIAMGFGLIGLRLIVSYRARKAKNSSS
jgi:hypothetical protein